MSAHSRLIRTLVQEIRNGRFALQEALGEVETANESANWASQRAYENQQRAENQAARCRREADEARREAEQRDWDRQSATRELERARSWGDSWAEERAVRKLKNL